MSKIEDDENSSSSEDEEIVEEDEVELDIPDEEEEDNDAEENMEDIIEDAVDDDEEGGISREPTAKKVVKRKDAKRRIFPFIQKKKHIFQIDTRSEPIFITLDKDDIRKTTKSLMKKDFNLSDKQLELLEKKIYNATVRECKRKETKLKLDFKRYIQKYCAM